jgi:hypothetical protein
MQPPDGATAGSAVGGLLGALWADRDQDGTTYPVVGTGAAIGAASGAGLGAVVGGIGPAPTPMPTGGTATATIPTAPLAPGSPPAAGERDQASLGPNPALRGAAARPVRSRAPASSRPLSAREAMLARRPAAPPAAAQRRLCQVTRVPETTEQCADFQVQMEGLDDRAVDFEPARNMFVGIEYTVKSRVRRIRPGEQLPDDGSAVTSPGGAATFAMVALPNMSAQLLGDGFEISPTGWQAAPESGSLEASWAWQVTPRREGLLKLEMIVVPEVVAGSRRVKLETFARHENVTVTVKPKSVLEQVQDALTSATGLVVSLTTLLGALGGLWAWFRKGGPAPGPAVPDPRPA